MDMVAMGHGSSDSDSGDPGKRSKSKRRKNSNASSGSVVAGIVSRYRQYVPAETSRIESPALSKFAHKITVMRRARCLNEKTRAPGAGVFGGLEIY